MTQDEIEAVEVEILELARGEYHGDRRAAAVHIILEARREGDSWHRRWGEAVDCLTAERDEARRERDEARRERDGLRAKDRERRQRLWLEADGEKQRLIAERDAALRERDTARNELAYAQERRRFEGKVLAERCETLESEKEAALARVRELEARVSTFEESSKLDVENGNRAWARVRELEAQNKHAEEAAEARYRDGVDDGRSEMRERIAQLEARVRDVTADRDEWRQQHENLLAMYQASVAQVADLRAQGAENARLRAAYDKAWIDHDMADYDGGDIVYRVQDLLMDLGAALDGEKEKP